MKLGVLDGKLTPRWKLQNWRQKFCNPPWNECISLKVDKPPLRVFFLCFIPPINAGNPEYVWIFLIVTIRIHLQNNSSLAQIGKL